MKFDFRYLIIVFFTILVILILSLKTTWKVCTVCGAQRFERTLFGKEVPFFSQYEVDEYGTYKKWREIHGTTCRHQWQEVDEYGINSLPE
ncbi:MAG: hypothetical protein KDC56_09740 [Flavobacteriaceae bacterium]|nr:hypothetical protein [Flavobacteriaceae bacterium]